MKIKERERREKDNVRETIRAINCRRKSLGKIERSIAVTDFFEDTDLIEKVDLSAQWLRRIVLRSLAGSHLSHRKKTLDLGIRQAKPKRKQTRETKNKNPTTCHREKEKMTKNDDVMGVSSFLFFFFIR